MVNYTTDYKSDIYKPNTIFKSKSGENFIIVGKSIDRKGFMCGYFDNDNNTIIEVDIKSLKSCIFKNKNNPSVYGVGYIGYGEYDSKNSKKFYKTWCGMLERCYVDSVKNKYLVTYKNVAVCEEWLNFQNFAKWCSRTYIKGYQLDKDLKQFGVKNKIYSPETCVWLDKFINSFIRFDFCGKNYNLGLRHRKNSEHVEVSISLGDRNSTSIVCKNKEDAVNINSYLRNFKIDNIKAYMYELNIYSLSTINSLDLFKADLKHIPCGYEDKINRAKLKITEYVQSAKALKDKLNG